MKKFFLVSLALASSMSFAADVDYTRCSMYGGLQFDNEGHVVANNFQKIKSQTTEGNKEKIVFESSYGNKKMESVFEVERDSQGRPVKIVSGGDRPSEQLLQSYRDSMVDGAVMGAAFSSGATSNMSRTNFMAQEPKYFVKKQNAPANPDSKNGVIVKNGSVRMDPNYEMVSLSDLTKDQAKSVGIDNVDELKRLRQQWRKDKKTTERLKDNYRKVVDRSALAVWIGQEVEMDIQDGVCLPKSMSSRIYNSQSGQVNTFPISSRENCDKIRAVYQRNQRKIEECNEATNKLSLDYYKEMFGNANPYGMGSGGSVGGAVHGGMYGGYGMGLAGGIAGGGMYGGYGMGMGGMGMYGMGNMYGGTDMQSIQMQNQMCEWNYSRSQQNVPAAGGSTGEASVQAQ